MTAGNALTIAASGIVSANGGNGALSDTGASGGGSGGGIVLRSPAISHAGILRANGGVGGGGGCCGGGGGAGGGRILIRGALSGAGSISANGGPASSGNGGGAAGSPGIVSTVADLGYAITKTDLVTTEVPGTPVTYTITVVNSTAQAELDVPVADTFAAILGGVTYTAVGTGGASGFTASGSGPIDDEIDLPAGSSVTYTVTGTISAAATGTLSNRACAGPNFALDHRRSPAGGQRRHHQDRRRHDGGAGHRPPTRSSRPMPARAAHRRDRRRHLPGVLTCTWTCVGAGGGTCTASRLRQHQATA